MSPTRRDFLRLSALAGGALGLGGLSGCGAADTDATDATGGAPAEPPRPDPMRILILGGTGFVGPNQVRRARERGHTLTLFNRGVTNPDLFPDVEHLPGDRSVPDYGSLEGREWDFVIDNSANDPEWARGATEALAGRVGGYLFLSSTGVYYPYAQPGADETVAPLTEGDMENVGSRFGVNKARGEQVVLEAFPETGAVVRPTYIAGPGDPTDRILYYALRVEQGGEVLVPTFSDPAQFVDVRDATRFMIHMVEQRLSGIYNVTGPEPGQYTIGRYVEAIQEVVDSDATITEVDSDFLIERDVRYILPWAATVGDAVAMMQIDGGKAEAAGMVHRPVTETVADSLAWYHAQSEERKAQTRPQIPADAEAELLAAWHQAQGATA